MGCDLRKKKPDAAQIASLVQDRTSSHINHSAVDRGGISVQRKGRKGKERKRDKEMLGFRASASPQEREREHFSSFNTLAIKQVG